jgi:protein-disulfide isomerase
LCPEKTTQKEDRTVKNVTAEVAEKGARRSQKKQIWMIGTLGACVLALSLFAGQVSAQSPAAVPASGTSKTVNASSQSPLQKSVEAYLRHLYAFGPDVQLTISEPKPSLVAGLLETTVELKNGESSETAKFYVSADGKYLVRGDVSDLSKDPLAETRKLIQMQDAPSIGNPQAPITLVEFSDFECPVCKNLHDALRGILPNYPQVRVVFKDFPIEQLHPWARTAALAGRCAYQEDPKAFWKLYDAIYDHQDVISAANAWTKMNEYAADAGLNAEKFRSCLASPGAGEAVNASRANGQQLEVNSTPTVFVNGRRIVGADAQLLERYIQYEAAQLKANKTASK